MATSLRDLSDPIRIQAMLASSPPHLERACLDGEEPSRCVMRDSLGQVNAGDVLHFGFTHLDDQDQEKTAKVHPVISSAVDTVLRRFVRSMFHAHAIAHARRCTAYLDFGDSAEMAPICKKSKN